MLCSHNYTDSKRQKDDETTNTGPVDEGCCIKNTDYYSYNNLEISQRFIETIIKN